MNGSVPSREAFATRYRSLAMDERGAFVADLRAARGWETTVEGAVVVARRDGTVRRIAVDRPDGDTTVDAVVAAEEGLRSFAENRDVEMLDPGTLRDELFYGLDTQEGTELFGTHFGDIDIHPPDEGGKPAGTGESRTGDASGLRGYGTEYPWSASRDRPGGGERSRAGHGGGQTETDSPGTGSEDDTDEPDGVVSLAVVLAAAVVFVLLFVFTSGSGAVALPDLLSGGDTIETAGTDPATADESTAPSDNSTTETETGASDGSDKGRKSWGSPAGTQGNPPFRNGTHDAGQIATAHAAAIRDYESFRFRVQSEGPTHTGEIEPPRDLDVRIAGNNQFLVEEEDIASSAGESVSIDVFADGYLEYWRFDGPAGVRYNRGAIRTAPTVIDWSGEYGGDLIRTYLNVSESTVERGYVDDPIAYRIIVDSPPPALAGSAVDYRAAATVMSDGSVQTLTVRYRHEPSGEEVWLRLQYDIGDPSIETPVWYDRAREQFDSGIQPEA